MPFDDHNAVYLAQQAQVAAYASVACFAVCDVHLPAISLVASALTEADSIAWIAGVHFGLDALY